MVRVVKKVPVRSLALTRGRRALVTYAGLPDPESLQYAVEGLPEGWRGYVATSHMRWKVLLVEPHGPVPVWTGDYPGLRAALEGLRMQCESRRLRQRDESALGGEAASGSR